jgi:MFS transporter, putative metabolite:H+ symporter
LNGSPSKYARMSGPFGLSAFHTRLLWATGLGWLLAAFDLGLLFPLLPRVAADLRMGATQSTLAVALTFLGMLGGAAAGGTLADRYGRKSLFIKAVVLAAFGTGLSGAAWDPNSFLAFQFVAGLGLGAVFPVGAVLVSEWSPVRVRGRLVVLLSVFFSLGLVLAVAVGLWLVPLPALAPNVGWRIAFGIGALPMLYPLVARRALPASARYLAANGHTEEAQAALRLAVRLAGSSAGSIPEFEQIRPSTIRPAMTERWHSLFSRPLARRTLMLWLLWFGTGFVYYWFFTWLSGVVLGRLTGLNSLQYNLIVASVPIAGFLLAAGLVEWVGRKYTLIGYLAGTALAAVLFRGASSPEQATIYGSLLALFALGAWAVLYAYTTELYPTRIRGWGTGVAAAVGWMGFLLALLITREREGGRAPDNGGVNLALSLVLLLLAIMGAAAFWLGEKTEGRTLEDISMAATPPLPADSVVEVEI